MFSKRSLCVIGNTMAWPGETRSLQKAKLANLNELSELFGGPEGDY